MKHTSGPWEAVLPDDPRGQPVGFYRGLVALVSMDPPVSVVAESGYVDSKDWQANARLIAAAPELYDALRDLVACHRGKEQSVGNWDHFLERAEAALAKAASP